MICNYLKVRINPITHKKTLTRCGKCIPCRVGYRIPWEYRLYQEYKKHNYQGCFCTLTYSDDKYDINNGLNYEHIQNYHKRLRSQGLKFKFFVVGEYGEHTARCHWHELLFGVPYEARHFLFKNWSWCYEPMFVVSPITTGRIRYCLKYLDKESVSVNDWEDGSKQRNFEFLLDSAKLMYNVKEFQRPRSYCSQGLGKDNYINRFEDLYDKGTFSEGFMTYKPSKYQIDCVSRSDINFHIARNKWIDKSDYYQRQLKVYGSDYEVNRQELIKSVNYTKVVNTGALQQGDSVRVLTDDDVADSFRLLEANFKQSASKNRLSLNSLYLKDLSSLALEV